MAFLVCPGDRGFAPRGRAKIGYAPPGIGNAGRAAARVAGSFPSRNARVAREAKTDHDQAAEIPGFRARETDDNRRAQAGRQRFPSSAQLPRQTSSGI
jgi:hypothetical protein